MFTNISFRIVPKSEILICGTIEAHTTLSIEIPTDAVGSCSYCWKSLNMPKEIFKFVLHNDEMSRWFCENCFKNVCGEILKISIEEKFKNIKDWNFGDKDNNFLLNSWAEREGYCSYCWTKIKQEEFKLIMNIGREWKNDITDDRWFCKDCFTNFQNYMVKIYNEHFYKNPKIINMKKIRRIRRLQEGLKKYFTSEAK
jgi:hypothetical protein